MRFVKISEKANLFASLKSK